MRFKYIDTSGQTRTIEANDAQSALTSAINIAPGSGVMLDIQNVSPVTNNGIDLSLVGNVGAIVPVPVAPPPLAPTQPFASTPQVTVVSTRDNPDGTVTNFLSDGTSDTGRITIGADGQGTFTPSGSLLTSGIDSVRNEINVIEQRMLNRTTERATSLEQVGVFDDMRRLNELNATLRQAQDRQLEVPIEQRRNLRGRGATLTEFEQATRPGLERAVLQELTASRASTRITDTINTNIKIIDTKINAEKDRDEFIYKQKQDYLKTLETNYANIITEQQKIELEERKFKNELTRDALTAERTARQKQLDLAVEKGASSTELNRLIGGSTDDIYAWNAEHAEGNEENAALQQSAIDVVSLIDEILLNEVGLKSSVGATKLGRTRGGNVPIPLFGALAGLISTGSEEATGISPLGDKISQFRNSAGQLVSQEILQTLLDLKSQGGTLGAISKDELLLLTNAATDLGPVKDGNDKNTGQFAVSEDRFKEIVELIQVTSMKTYIASRIGKEAYKQTGYINANTPELIADVRKTYEELLKTQSGNQDNSTNFYQSDLNPTLNLIKTEEGFSPTAYQDSTGTWTIGYGNTTINGRPVTASDTISKTEADALLKDSVVSRYSTGARAVGTSLSENQQAALISFEYNLGSGVWQTATGQRILSLIATGNYAQAGQLMQQYNQSRNANTGFLETNPVLTGRRAREAALLLS